MESLVKQAADRKVFHIEDHILAMNELELLKRFDVPINIKDILDANEKHQKEIGKLSSRGISAYVVVLFGSSPISLPSFCKKRISI